MTTSRPTTGPTTGPTTRPTTGPTAGPTAGPSTGPATGAPGPEVPLYVISVAAQLTGLHPQTLRTYDRLGLVSPGRSGGGGRRYSWQDVQVLRDIAELTAAGIGLEGVRRILHLEARMSGLQERVRELEEELAATRYALGNARADRGSTRNLPAVPEPAASRTGGRSVVLWAEGRKYVTRDFGQG